MSLDYLSLPSSSFARPTVNKHAVRHCDDPAAFAPFCPIVLLVRGVDGRPDDELLRHAKSQCIKNARNQRRSADYLIFGATPDTEKARKRQSAESDGSINIA
eukprot:scaffold13134_cov52-Attheya_sp.AAC.3